MNLTTAVFLINKDLRAILAVYEKHDEPKHQAPGTFAGPEYYQSNVKKTMFKTLDKSISPGDFIVVPTGTRHNMTVVKVTDVDVTVNFDDPNPVQWVIHRLDLTQHEETLKQEAQAVEAIKLADFNKRRRDMFNSMIHDDDVVDLKSLPLYKNGNEKEGS